MQKLRTMMLVIAAGAAVGCTHRSEPPRHASRARPVESRADWAKLGERWVDGAHDRDVISLRDGDRRFRRLMIVVEDSALEMFDVVVTFGDGTRYSPPTRHVFAENTRSHVIDLPGSQRSIRSVEFRYGNLPGGGRARAELWAQ
jgi:hypothetical protein